MESDEAPVAGVAHGKVVINSLEACLKENTKDFYNVIGEGSRNFIPQRCSNGRGKYMALRELGGGGRHNFIFIPERMKGRDGGGWWKCYGSV